MNGIENLFIDYSVSYSTEGTKRHREGWLQVECPYCKGSSHLGYNTYDNYWNCWACGWKPLIPTLAFLIGVSESEARTIYNTYVKNDEIGYIPKKKKGKVLPEEIKLPEGTCAMSERHLNYLYSRNFDAKYLEKEYKLQGTGPAGFYKHRIVIPIYFRNRLVTYQTRDITGKSMNKYLAAEEGNEVIPIKSCLYNIDKAVSKSIIVCEGVAGVWRLGKGSVSTFGVEFSKMQLRLLSHYQRVIVLFDPDTAGEGMGEKLADEMSVFSNVEIVKLDEGNRDIGDYTECEIKAILKELNFKIKI